LSPRSDLNEHIPTGAGDGADSASDPQRPSDHVDGSGPTDGGINQPKLGFVGYLRFFWRQLTSMRTALFLLMLLALAAIAGWVVATQRRLSARWWLLVPVAAVVVTTIVFYGAHRIRAPAEPAVIVLAAIGLVVGRDRSGRSADTLVA
jgi:hypothetical protein